MTSLFISYSRKDINAARKLTEVFKGQDLDFWIDWEGIPPTVDWWKEIQKGIEDAAIFVFLLSPDSCASKICKEELEHAAKNGKRLIPVVVRDIKADESPTEIRHLNWIFLRPEDDFDTAFRKLIVAVKTDYSWVQAHRQLQVKALEWERSGYKRAFMLHGEELADAEVQLATNSSKEPYPTYLQREYVLKSRQTSDRQRRTLMGAGIVAIIALVVLASYGFSQANLATNRANIANTAQAQAEEQAKIARAGELAAQSAAAREKNFQVSLLLAIEAFRTFDMVRTRGNLLGATQTNPQLLRFLPGKIGTFSPNGTMLASSAGDTVILWDINTHQQIGKPFQGHADGSSVVFSPDGKMLASGGDDGSIILWDIDSHQQIDAPLKGYAGFVVRLAFSPDGTKLISESSQDGTETIILWDVETRQQIGKPFQGGSSAAFSPNSKTLALSSDDDSSLILWDVYTHQQIGEPIQGLGDFSWIKVFSPDGTKLVSLNSWDGNIILWDVDTHRQISEPFQGGVSSVAFSPNSKMLALGGNDGTIILWDVETRQQIGEALQVEVGSINNLIFSTDGTMLALGKDDGTIILWDVETRQQIREPLQGYLGSAYVMDFSPDGKTLASSDGHGTIILWSVETRQEISKPLADEEPGSIHSVAFSPDGTKLASADSDNKTIILWDIATYEPTGDTFPEHISSVYDIVFSPDGKTLASSDSNGTIILWNVETRQKIGEPLVGPDGSMSNITFSPDGKMLASTSFNGIILWDVRTSQKIDEFSRGDCHACVPVNGVNKLVAFSPDGKMLASGSVAGIILWDVETRQKIGELSHPSLWDFAFSPDGKTLASGDAVGTIILWDVKARQSIGEPLRGHRGPVDSVNFSPNGQTLASGSSSDNTFILWDVKTRQPIGELLSGPVLSVAFSPDSKTLALGSVASITLWDVETASWIEKSCWRAGRNFTQEEWAQYIPSEEYHKTCEQWPLEPAITP